MQKLPDFLDWALSARPPVLMQEGEVLQINRL